MRHVLVRKRQTMTAQIIGAPLQQGSPNRHAQCRAHQGQIAMKQLVLKIARPGRDQHLAPGQDGGHEIGECLAGSGSRLADQGTALLHEGGDALRHRLLLRAMRKTGKTLGEPAVRAEDGGEIRHRLGAEA
jgi:hypothetical protein